jgi:hypothetical protein
MIAVVGLLAYMASIHDGPTAHRVRQFLVRTGDRLRQMRKR